MGLQQSKEELLYQQVSYRNVEGIKALHRDGAGLEWVDREGKTPLIHACMIPNGLPVVKTLIDLGANVNAYRPGCHNGTPLHHAAKRGMGQAVDLLLAHGANLMKVNDDCETALDLARAKGHSNVVRAIESRICLFSGWLRQNYGPDILEALAPKLLSRKIWAVVLPCDHRNPMNPSRFQLIIYPDLQKSIDGGREIRCRRRRRQIDRKIGRFGCEAARPYTVIPLWKAKIEGPNFNHLDPAVVIVDKRNRARYKLLSANEGDKQQLMCFYDACQGIPQRSFPVQPIPVPPASATPVSTPTTGPDDVELAMAINASIQSAIAEGVRLPDTTTTQPIPRISISNGLENSEGAILNGWAGQEPGPSMPSHNKQSQQQEDLVPVLVQTKQDAPALVVVPSAPPITEETFRDGVIHYPSIDLSHVDLPIPPKESKAGTSEEKESCGGASDPSCVICLDAPVEGACIPCGHMAGCMSCLNEIKGKDWGCPVCRAKIDQVIKLYAV